jgi:enterochelin esterase-like enzyme
MMYNFKKTKEGMYIMKFKPLLLSGVLLLSLSACSEKNASEAPPEIEASTNTVSANQPAVSGTALANSMTAKEKSNTAFRDLTLLDSDAASKIGTNLDKWTFVQYDTESIKDSINELKIYDEELDTNFLAHIILPPDYDSAQTYPVFFISDGVWWLGEVPAMWNTIKNGEAEPVIFVTLSYDYDTDPTTDETRVDKFILNQDKTLDFITNNLMPYVSEQYSINCKDSTFFGHSCGGLFSHYALCMSDQYENQPFGKYIIGSPVFWAYYMVTDSDDVTDKYPYLSDFGYWERNTAMNKKVFLCAGEFEDSDYREMFNGHESTTEGVQALYDRFVSHGVMVTKKLYPANHIQFMPDMFKDYIRMEYPVNALR